MTVAIERTKAPNVGFGEEVLRLRKLFGLTQKEFGEIIGTNERTVVRWESEASEGVVSATPSRTSKPHAQSRASINAMAELAEMLGDLFEPDVIKIWVDRPNPALGNERPRDFAKKPGGIYRMASLLDALRR